MSTLHFPVAAFMKIDKWSPDTPVYGDIDGGFPLVVFDSEMENAVVMAPATDFMSANQATFTDPVTGEKTLAFGPLSSITEVRRIIMQLYIHVYFTIMDLRFIIIPYNLCVYKSITVSHHHQLYTVSHASHPFLSPQLPQGYTFSTILVAGDNVTDAMMLFGNSLRTQYGKDDSYRKTDFTINYLGLVSTRNKL